MTDTLDGRAPAVNPDGLLTALSGSSSAVLGSLDLRTRRNGLVRGAWNLLRTIGSDASDMLKKAVPQLPPTASHP